MELTEEILNNNIDDTDILYIARLEELLDIDRKPTKHESIRTTIARTIMLQIFQRKSNMRNICGSVFIKPDEYVIFGSDNILHTATHYYDKVTNTHIPIAKWILDTILNIMITRLENMKIGRIIDKRVESHNESIDEIIRYQNIIATHIHHSKIHGDVYYAVIRRYITTRVYTDKFYDYPYFVYNDDDIY